MKAMMKVFRIDRKPFCMFQKSSNKSMMSRNEFLHYSRLCSIFLIYLGRTCLLSLTKIVMVTKKAKKEQKLSWSTCPKGKDQNDH